MVPPPTGRPADAGHSYDGLLVRAGRAALVERLRQLRFTGWIGPQEACWLVVVAAATRGAVAGQGRCLDHLAAELADSCDAAVLAVSVRADRALALALWNGPEEIGRYWSDRTASGLAFAGPPATTFAGDPDAPPEPARHHFADLAALGDPAALAALAGLSAAEEEGPIGVDHACAFAAALGRPEAGEALGELLAGVLDCEEEIESERLVAVLDLFGLPRWLVAARSLPRDVPGGPRASELLRLHAGREGASGQVRGWVIERVRTRRRPA